MGSSREELNFEQKRKQSTCTDKESRKENRVQKFSTKWECLAPTQNAMQWPEMMAKERERTYMDYIVSIIQSSKKIEEGGVVHMAENKREVVGEATQDHS